MKHILLSIAILKVTSPIVINVPTRDLLAVETKNVFALWLAKFKFINREVTYWCMVLRTVPTIVIAHTFCASPDTRISYPGRGGGGYSLIWAI